MTGGTRKGLYRVHSWLGLNLGLLLFVVCLSGTLAVFGPELTWLTEPALRVEPPPKADRTPLSWQKIHDSVQERHPDAVILRLAAPRGPYWAARAVVGHGPRDFRVVLVDPFTGKVQGQRSTFNAQSFLRILHKQFYIVPSLTGIHGVLVVGALGVVLLISAVTGMLSVKRWWRSLTRLRTGKGKGVLWSDLHRFSGLWSLIVALLIAVTGIWYLAEWTLHETDVLTEAVPPARVSEASLRELPASPVLIDLDRAASLAQTALPGLSPTTVTLPRRIGDPLVIAGQANAWLVRNHANQVHLHPYTGAVLGMRDASDLGALDRWVETADPLHFGTWGGLGARIVWFIAGVLMCGGILAGISGAWHRRPPARSPRGIPWSGLAAVLPAVTVLAVAVHGTLTYGLGQHLRAQAASATVTYSAFAIGPWEMILRGPAEGTDADRGIAFLIRSTDGSHSNNAGAEAWVFNGNGTRQPLTVRQMPGRILLTGKAVDKGCAPSCRLSLVIKDRIGRDHTARIDLPPLPGQNQSHDTVLLEPVPELPAGFILLIAVFIGLSIWPAVTWTRLILSR